MALRVLQLTRIPLSQWRFLMPFFRELRARGHVVESACGDAPAAEKIAAEGFLVHRFSLTRSLNPVNLLAAVAALKKLMQRRRYDVVVTHMPMASGVGRVAARWAGVPCVIYFSHGLPSAPNMNPLLWALWAGVEWVLSHFHHGLVVMNEYDRRLAQRLPLVRPANMLFMGEGVGVNLARWHDLPGDVRARKRAELELPDGVPVVLMAARTDARKGAFEYVRAAARLLQTGEAADAVFLLAGTGPCDERLRALVRELGVSDHVRLLGWRADMAELVGLCDLFVLPSYYPEGRPTVLAEAQAAGKPVVTTRYRGCQDAVVEGKTALLVPPRDVPALADAMTRVLRDAELGRSLGEAGRRHAHAHFDAERLAARFADIVEVVARYRGRAVGSP